MVPSSSFPSFDELRSSCAEERRASMNFDSIVGRECPCASNGPSRKAAFITSRKVKGKLESEDRSPHINIFGRFYLVVSTQAFADSTDSRFAYFSIDNILNYVGFCDDFGPMSLGTIFQFCAIVDHQLNRHESLKIAMRTGSDCKTLTNAVFLIGTYMILKLGSTPNGLEESLLSCEVLSKKLLSYRDVSPGEQNFHLTLKDCWTGLWKALELGWVDAGDAGFDAEEYDHYDNPLNADLHEIVPGRFIAMRGPIDLPDGQLWQDTFTTDGRFSHREFSPAHYIEILRLMDVQAVIRLNNPEYNQEVFTSTGIPVADLPFDDCTCPPANVVAKFMLIAEGLPGPLALHCSAGLGRTGTLIALYMMAHYGFSAREAMGWIRIVRPGSIIGAQQHYLCEREEVMRRTGALFRGPVCSLRSPDPAGVAALIDEAVRVVDARFQVLRIRRRLTGTGPSGPGRTGSAFAGTSSAIDAERLAAHVSSSADRRVLIRSGGCAATAGEAAAVACAGIVAEIGRRTSCPCSGVRTPLE